MSELRTTLAYLPLLRRYVPLVVVMGALGAGFSGFLVFKVIPPTYQAMATLLVLPPSSGGALGGALSQLETQLDAVGPLRSLVNLPRSSSVNDLVSILRSRSLAEKVAAQVKLETLKPIQELQRLPLKPDELARRRVAFLQQQVAVYAPDSRDSTLRVVVRLQDRKLPAEVANQYVQALETYLRGLIQGDTRDQQQFIDQQLKEMDTQLQQAEEALLAFQKRYRTVSLSDEIKQYITYLAELEADELAARTALKENQARQQTLEGEVSELTPTFGDQLTQLEANRQALLKRQGELKTARLRYEKILATLPAQALELARLERRVTMRSRLYLVLSQQAQALRLEASRSAPLFKVLDRAIEADRPVAPVKRVVIGVSGMISMCIGIFLALLHVWWVKTRKELNNYGEEA
jgi:uncharacterized protein involved in exopolysaccharide biosynthesis